MFKRIRDLREDHDLTQKEVAAKLSMSSPQYQRYESGTVTPPIDVIIFLADLYGVSVDYILDRTNSKEMFPKEFEDGSAEIKRFIAYLKDLNSTNKDIIIGTMASMIKEQKLETSTKRKEIG